MNKDQPNSNSSPRGKGQQQEGQPAKPKKAGRFANLNLRRNKNKKSPNKKNQLLYVNNTNKEIKNKLRRLDESQMALVEISGVLQKLQQTIDYYDRLERSMYNTHLDVLLERMDHPNPSDIHGSNMKSCKSKLKSVLICPILCLFLGFC